MSLALFRNLNQLQCLMWTEPVLGGWGNDGRGAALTSAPVAPVSAHIRRPALGTLDIEMSSGAFLVNINNSQLFVEKNGHISMLDILEVRELYIYLAKGKIGEMCRVCCVIRIKAKEKFPFLTNRENAMLYI